MDSTGPWADFEGHKNSIRLNTVAKLQTIISGWTDQCRVQIPKSGKKQDLIDRMTRVMDDWRETNQLDKWLRAKVVLDQVRETGLYSHYSTAADLNNGYSPTSNPPYVAPGSHKVNGGIPFPSPSGAGPSHLRYDAYAPPRKAVTSVATPASPVKPGIRFKSSPFYKVEQPVSSVVECPESTSAMDRRSQSLNFTLTSEQLSKLQMANSRYQLRLFCTSSMYHSHHHTGFRTEPPCPIEFPATCEVRVNNIQLTANLKGLKKKPGTAPPPDLGNAIRLTSQVSNRVDMVYVNSQQPVQHKKFYMVAYLVEVTTVQQLVEKLRKGKYKGESEIRAKMIQTATFDDDIIAGPQKMSLKCPLSYMRVETPCRSIQCPHAQCFDATSWFSMMEQTTTWLCPVCDKVLNVEELIIDGYFDRILRETPESVEDVMVEADGEWHTSDNKYASVGWSPTVSTSAQSSKAEPPRKALEKPVASSSSVNPSHNRSRQEVISLDSDSDDEGIVKRELSPTSGYTTSPQSQSQSQSLNPNMSRSAPEPLSNEVIDLTLDSDDEAPPNAPLLIHATLKRKEREAEVNDDSAVWKKSRYARPPAPGSETSGEYVNSIRSSNPPNDRGLSRGYSTSSGTSISGANGWGPVRIPTSAPTQSAYQPPYTHTGPSTHGSSLVPFHSQSLNSMYPNYAPSHSRPMDLALPVPPISTHSAPYRSSISGNPPPR